MTEQVRCPACGCTARSWQFQLAWLNLYVMTVLVHRGSCPYEQPWDKKRVKWLPIVSLSYGMSPPLRRGGRADGQ